MEKILVSTDGSEYSKRALLKAKKIAKGMESEVTVVSVLTLLHHNFYPQIQTELRKTDMERVETILKEAEEIFSDFEGKFSTIYKIGDAADEIITLAEEGDYDLLIMGSRGLGAFSRTLLGSVSDKVIHHVKTSTMIVK